MPIAARRWDWFESQLDLDPRRLVFIDETGASTKMARLRASIFNHTPNPKGIPQTDSLSSNRALARSFSPHRSHRRDLDFEFWV